MKYVSIDIETTGLNPETCQILSIGAVIEDTEKQLPFEEIPKFHCVIPSETINGEPYALNLNRDLIGLIKEYYSTDLEDREALGLKNNVIFLYKENVWKAFNEFLIKNNMFGKVTIAGKNYLAFDKGFLSRLEGWDTLGWHRRVIDPATSFVDWKNDTELPDLNTCKKRAGLSGEVTHNALEDAYDVVKVLRTKY